MERDWIGEILDNSAEREELDEKDMYEGPFIGRIAKSYKVGLLVAGVLMLAFAIFAYAVDDGGSREWSFLLFAIDALIWLYVPTVVSCRVEISKDMIAEQYLVVFIRVRREIAWNDVKYRKIRQDDLTGKVDRVHLYNADGKRVMSFDRGTIGFSRILKLAKRSAIKDIDKK